MITVLLGVIINMKYSLGPHVLVIPVFDPFTSLCYTCLWFLSHLTSNDYDSLLDTEMYHFRGPFKGGPYSNTLQRGGLGC